MEINQDVLDKHEAAFHRAVRDPRVSPRHLMVLLALMELADPETGEIACSVEDIEAKVVDIQAELARARLDG